MFYKDVGDVEAGYYGFSCQLTNYIYHSRCVSDVLLALYIFRGLLKLSNFEDEILLKEGRNVTLGFFKLQV